MKWRIGEVTVTKIVELEVIGGSRFMLPQATPEAILPIAAMDERLRPGLVAADAPLSAGGGQRPIIFQNWAEADSLDAPGGHLPTDSR